MAIPGSPPDSPARVVAGLRVGVGGEPGEIVVVRPGFRVIGRLDGRAYRYLDPQILGYRGGRRGGGGPAPPPGPGPPPPHQNPRQPAHPPPHTGPPSRCAESGAPRKRLCSKALA